ncbi:hypothetical protein COJ85_17615 [Bacillus sp. AFS076308]|uniref:YkvA family protein n=1 Tax=unclassified Bacillus (in: firmicutes) TaxID=185979 RepID=UPI000BF5234C|nr:MULTISPECIES: YkvA family protein [unclassified Bacillus (in: firmicutes)]PFO01234.1 hypothetical protein COJ85_17615 [Bacillus sp. AFS076308]PGV50063.1 hypothetical protein COD92_19575 [Bacillus sp. AFS037270]
MEKVNVITKLKNYARKLKQYLFVLFLSYKDNRVPWYAKIVAISVVAYAFSPIDLIPDFIPVLGYLDDLIIVPLGISLALRLIPPHVIKENRMKAEDMRKNGKQKNWLVGILFILIWIVFAVWIGKLIFELFN